MVTVCTCVRCVYICVCKEKADRARWVVHKQKWKWPGNVLTTGKVIISIHSTLPYQTAFLKTNKVLRLQKVVGMCIIFAGY